jgi:hypothetical protein
VYDDGVSLASLLKPPPPPHEHGGWALLFIPLVLGTAASGALAPAPLLVWPAVVLGFFARYAAIPVAVRLAAGKSAPREIVVRRFVWTGLYMTASAACFALAVLLAPQGARAATVLMALLAGALALAHSGLALAGKDRTLWGELIGMAGLAASAPLLVAAGGTTPGARAAGAFALSLAYALSTLSFVRSFRNLQAGRLLSIAACGAVHLALGLLLGALWLAGWVPLAGLASFALLILRSAWGLLLPPAGLRAIGMREVGVAAAFALMCALGLIAAKP